jgi:hypothetical protein
MFFRSRLNQADSQVLTHFSENVGHVLPSTVEVPLTYFLTGLAFKELTDVLNILSDIRQWGNSVLNRWIAQIP